MNIEASAVRGDNPALANTRPKAERSGARREIGKELDKIAPVIERAA
jgi:hypothetical protein